MNLGRHTFFDFQQVTTTFPPEAGRIHLSPNRTPIFEFPASEHHFPQTYSEHPGLLTATKGSLENLPEIYKIPHRRRLPPTSYRCPLH